MNAAELEQLADELGIDVVGAAPAEPYEETEQHIRDRRARGLFADMRFTMARPEVSCHPEQLLPNARTVVSAALCYYADEPERPRSEEHTSELQSHVNLVCRLLLEKKKTNIICLVSRIKNNKT